MSANVVSISNITLDGETLSVTVNAINGATPATTVCVKVYKINCEPGDDDCKPDELPLTYSAVDDIDGVQHKRPDPNGDGVSFEFDMLEGDEFCVVAWGFWADSGQPLQTNQRGESGSAIVKRGSQPTNTFSASLRLEGIEEGEESPSQPYTDVTALVTITNGPEDPAHLYPVVKFQTINPTQNSLPSVPPTVGGYQISQPTQHQDGALSYSLYSSTPFGNDQLNVWVTLPSTGETFAASVQFTEV